MAPRTALHPVDTPPADAGPPAPPKATWHLSAGAYLDETFRTRALRGSTTGPGGPSHGFDWSPCSDTARGPAARWCCAAVPPRRDFLEPHHVDVTGLRRRCHATPMSALDEGAQE